MSNQQGIRAERLARLAANPVLYVQQRIRQQIVDTLGEHGGTEQVLERIEYCIQNGDYGEAVGLAMALAEHKDVLARAQMTRLALSPLNMEAVPSSPSPARPTPPAGASSPASTGRTRPSGKVATPQKPPNTSAPSRPHTAPSSSPSKW